MLGSLDPIIIFQLYKLVPTAAATLAKIPLTSQAKTKATYAIIPIYLAEKLTGVYIESESKNMDIDTNPQSLTSGEGALVDQKALGSITTVNLVANQGSIGVTILLALSEMILDKVTSQEYEVTYMHGAVTVFGGLIHSLSYEQGTNDTLYRIKLEIARGRPKPSPIQVGQNPSAVRLGAGPAATPPAGSPLTSGQATGTPTSATSVIQPGRL